MIVVRAGNHAELHQLVVALTIKLKEPNGFETIIRC